MIEMIGIGMLFFIWQLGIAVIAAGIVVLAVHVMVENKGKEESKNCPKCGSAIPLKARICPECGYSYAGGAKEEELLDILEREQEEEDSLTSEEIDCDFERIE